MEKGDDRKQMYNQSDTMQAHEFMPNQEIQTKIRKTEADHQRSQGGRESETNGQISDKTQVKFDTPVVC